MDGWKSARPGFGVVRGWEEDGDWAIGVGRRLKAEILDFGSGLDGVGMVEEVVVDWQVAMRSF